MYLKDLLPLINLIPDYHKVGKFPALTRDLAVLVPISAKHADLLNIIREKGGQYLEGVHLFNNPLRTFLKNYKKKPGRNFVSLILHNNYKALSLQAGPCSV